MPNASAKTWSASFLASLTPGRRRTFLASLSARELDGLAYDWRFWARPEQLAPASDWHTWVILAGRGAGKTRCGAEWVRGCVCGPTPLGRGIYGRLALVAETAADARDVIVEGPAGLLQVHPAKFRPKFERSKRRLTWPNGAVAMLYNATERPLRGPQHDAAWRRMAKWRCAGRDAAIRLRRRVPARCHHHAAPGSMIREFVARKGRWR
jgi:phage terminase large subunit-like protein